MNITILSTFDNTGGAAIAAYRLFKGMQQSGQHPIMVVKDKRSENPFVYPIKLETPEYNLEQKIFQLIQKNEINKKRSTLSNTLFSFPYPGYDVSKAPIMQDADIINLHWVADFQSVETVSSLLNLEKPVIWTLHDENPFTGGCHYTAGCDGYIRECKNCKQLQEDIYQIPYFTLKNKKKLWKKNLTIVTPSRWLAQCAKKSSLFKDFRIEVIANSLETDSFKPISKEKAKKELGISPNVVTLLFGAYTGHEKRKGFIKLLEAMNYCLQEKEFKTLVQKKEIKILMFGPPQKDLEAFENEIISLGSVDIDNTERLSTIYSAADIFLLPSLEDNLPNTMLEAMACGTPVVSFDVGGMPDVIQNGITGYMAPCFNSNEFGRIILNLIFNKYERAKMSKSCRKIIQQKFKLQDQAGKYIELYNDLLKEKNNGKQTVSKKFQLPPHESEIILSSGNLVLERNYFEIYKINALKLLNTLNDNCQVLQNALSIKGSHLDELKKLLSDNTQKIQQKNEQISKMHDQFERLDAQKKTAFEQLEHNHGLLNQDRKQNVALKEEINQKNNQIDELTKQIIQDKVHINELVQQHKQTNLQVVELIEQLNKEKKQIEILSEQITRDQAYINEITEKLEYKNGHIGELAEKIKPKDLLINELKKDINRKDEQIFKLNQELKLKELGISTLTIESKNKDDQIRLLNTQIERHMDEIAGLYESLTYRIGTFITSPFRSISKGSKKKGNGKKS